MDRPTKNIVPAVSTDWTNHSFDENWLPGISFNNENDVLSNTNENQVENTTNKTTATSPSLHQIQSRRITPLANPAMQQTFRSPTHRRGGAGESSRHVRFACHEDLETCHAPPIISVLKEDEIRTLWWQNPELLQMKRFTRSLMMNRDAEDWVGLDRFTTERTAYKKRAVRLVLLAQHQQRTHAISDNPEEFIRAVSRRCSHWTRNMALTIAQHIHNEINFIERGEQVNVTPTSVIGVEGIAITAVTTKLGLNPTMGPSGSRNKRSRVGIDESSTNNSNVEGRRVLPKR